MDEGSLVLGNARDAPFFGSAGDVSEPKAGGGGDGGGGIGSTAYAGGFGGVDGLHETLGFGFFFLGASGE